MKITTNTTSSQWQLMFSLTKPHLILLSLLKSLVLLPLYHLFSFVSTLTSPRFNSAKWLGLVMALGLGVGFGLTIHRQPVLLQAELQTSSSKQTGIDNHLVSVTLIDQRLTIESQRWQLSSLTPILLKVPSSLDLTQIPLGTKLTAQGSNQGLYTYQIIDLAQRKKSKLSHIQPANKPTIVLYQNANLLGSEILTATAKRSN